MNSGRLPRYLKDWRSFLRYSYSLFSFLLLSFCESDIKAGLSLAMNMEIADLGRLRELHPDYHSSTASPSGLAAHRARRWRNRAATASRRTLQAASAPNKERHTVRASGRYKNTILNEDPLAQVDGARARASAPGTFYAEHQGSIIATTVPNGGSAAVNAYDDYGIPNAGSRRGSRTPGRHDCPVLRCAIARHGCTIWDRRFLG